MRPHTAISQDERPAASTSHRRSFTPLPPYEPPAERFTPPRDVYRTPPATPIRSSSRSNRPKSVHTRTIPGSVSKSTIKKPPIIDLSQPLPPASPTEDPLLLRGPPRRSSALKEANHQSYRDAASQSAHSSIADLAMSDGSFVDLYANTNMDTSDSMTSYDLPPLPALNLPTAGDFLEDDWSDSDVSSDGFDHTGEFTGKFKVLSVPTKRDPPSSCTRSRMEAWGRPVSPFPRGFEPEESPSPLALHTRELEDPRDCMAGMEVCGVFANVDSASFSSQIMSCEGPDVVPDRPPDEDMQKSSEIRPDSAVDSCGNMSSDRLLGLDGADAIFATVQDLVSDRSPQGNVYPSEANTSLEGERVASDAKPPLELSTSQEDVDAEAAFVDRELSRGLESDEETVTLMDGDCELGDEDSVEDEDMNESIIEITSGDPLAAARAAAILKLHNYDSVARSVASSKKGSNSTVDSKMRSARRKSPLSAGVTKRPARPPKRHTFGGIFGDHVFIPGSPAIALPELLKDHAVASPLPARTDDAEAASFWTGKDFKTPVKAPAVAEQDSSWSTYSLSHDTSIYRGWSKREWKLLDACFTDERLYVAAQHGSCDGALASVDDVVPENVVERFIRYFGGHDAFSQQFTQSRDDVVRRAQTLRKKQTSGVIAPPTPDFQRMISKVPPLNRSTLDVDTSLGPVTGPLKWNSYGTGGQSSSPADYDVSPMPRRSPGFSENLRPETHPPDDGNNTVPAGENDESFMSQTTASKDESPSLARRVKSFLYSYLSAPINASQKKNIVPQRPSLPVPPPSILERPRPPIFTPRPRPAPRDPHPKDVVQLHPVPHKPSLLPRPSRPPKDLVKLNHIPPPITPVPILPSLSASRGRRSSGASVKDLIQSFEELRDADADTNRRPPRKSHRDPRSKLDVRSNGRPIWKP